MTGSSPLLSGQLAQVAGARIKMPTACTEADLRRATSDLYYSLFHAVCEAIVAPLGARPEDPTFVETWQTLYRLPDHGSLEKRCKEAQSHAFSDPVKRFAQLLTELKAKRQKADYDPLATFAITEVQSDLARARVALDGFARVTMQERTRFAYFVALPQLKQRQG